MRVQVVVLLLPLLLSHAAVPVSALYHAAASLPPSAATRQGSFPAGTSSGECRCSLRPPGCLRLRQRFLARLLDDGKARRGAGRDALPPNWCSALVSTPTPFPRAGAPVLLRSPPSSRHLRFPTPITPHSVRLHVAAPRARARAPPPPPPPPTHTPRHATQGNLARHGHMMSTSGTWPYSYSHCQGGDAGLDLPGANKRQASLPSVLALTPPACRYLRWPTSACTPVLQSACPPTARPHRLSHPCPSSWQTRINSGLCPSLPPCAGHHRLPRPSRLRPRPVRTAAGRGARRP